MDDAEGRKLYTEIERLNSLKLRELEALRQTRNRLREYIAELDQQITAFEAQD
jgi:hypothetical protein